jgi:uncharacterized membrane protein
MPKESHTPMWFMFIVPVALAAVFLLDVAGPFDPVVSVLYLPLIVLSTRAFSRLGVTYIGIACTVLTCASFLLANVEGFDSVTVSQFASIVFSIALTTLPAVGLMRRLSQSLTS